MRSRTMHSAHPDHRDLEQMEPKVISLTPSEGGKLVVLLHNFGAHESLMHHDIRKFIFYHNFHLFFPIYGRKDFEK